MPLWSATTLLVAVAAASGVSEHSRYCGWPVFGDCCGSRVRLLVRNASLALFEVGVGRDVDPNVLVR